jgi:hypothetical protein
MIASALSFPFSRENGNSLYTYAATLSSSKASLPLPTTKVKHILGAGFFSASRGAKEEENRKTASVPETVPCRRLQLKK